MKKGRIVGVAFRHIESQEVLSLPSPARHDWLWKEVDDQRLGWMHRDVLQGFVNEDGEFLDRMAARELAVASGQVTKTGHDKYLFSEDLW